jgi:hypothetical protein
VQEGYYWIASDNDELGILMKCYPSEACPQSPIEESAKCAELYTGISCGSCIQGKSYLVNHECKKCGSKVVAVITLVVVLLGLIYLFTR